MDATVVSQPDGAEEQRIGEGGFSAAFAGSSIVSGHDQLELRSHTGELLRSSAPLGKSVRGLAASEDGRRVVAVFADGAAALWSPTESATPLIGDAHSYPGLAAAMTRDGRLAATSGFDKRVRIWTVEEAVGGEASLNPRCELNLEFSALDLDFSPPGDRLALAGTDGFRIIDTQTCTVEIDKTISDALEHLPKLAAPLAAKDTNGIAFTSDGADLISVGRDGVIRRWGGVDGGDLGIIARTNRNLSSVATCGPGRLVVGDEDGGVSVWQMTPDPSFLIVRTGATPTALAFAPGGKHLAITSDAENRAVTLVEISSGKRQQLDHSPRQPWLVGFSRDGAQLLAVGRDSLLFRWDTATLRGDSFQNLGGIVGRPFLSRDGSLLGAMKIGGIHLWKNSEKLEAIFIVPDPLISGAASHDGGRVAAVDTRSRTTRVWDTTTREQVGEFEIGSDVTALSLSPNGQHLVIGGLDGIVRLAEVDSGKIVLELLAHTREIWASAFAPDGRTFATGGGDGLVQVWDRETGTQVASLPGSQALIFALAFSADGKTIAAASFDGATRLYTIDPKRLLTRACERLGQRSDDRTHAICARYPANGDSP